MLLWIQREGMKSRETQTERGKRVGGGRPVIGCWVRWGEEGVSVWPDAFLFLYPHRRITKMQRERTHTHTKLTAGRANRKPSSNLLPGPKKGRGHRCRSALNKEEK